MSISLKLFTFTLTDVSRMSQRVIGKIPLGVGGVGAGAPPKCRPPSFLVRAAAAVGGQKKSCFDLAENWAADSLWVGAHRYTRILRVSKPLWANNAHKVEPNTRPIKNLSKSLLILKAPKMN